jgi:hypothetical protein
MRFICSSFLLLLFSNSALLAQHQYAGVEISTFYPFIPTKRIEHRFWPLYPEEQIKEKNISFSMKIAPGATLNAVWGFRLKKLKKIPVYFQTGIGLRYYYYALAYNGTFTDQTNTLHQYQLSYKKGEYAICFSENMVFDYKHFLFETGITPMLCIIGNDDYYHFISGVGEEHFSTNYNSKKGVGVKLSCTVQIGYSFVQKHFECVPVIKATLCMGDGESFAFGQVPIRTVVPLNTLGFGLKLLYRK